jgi:DNA-binding response OmpR family regulator
MRENEKRILIVDDDGAIRALLLTILKRRKFKVDTARNGAEALDRCTNCHYAVVLLDLMMPQMSGYEFLEKIAERPRSERPTILVLTAGSYPRNLNPDIVAGSVRKPFDIEMLLDTVTACLSTTEEKPQLDSCPVPDSEAGATNPGDEPN